MNKIHENKLTSYEAVSDLLENNQTITDQIPVLSEIIGRFNDLVDTIHEKAGKRDSLTKGKAKKKNQVENQLIREILRVGAALSVYAVSVGDTELKEKATVTKSDMKKMRDTELASFSQDLYGKIEANKTELANYGITEEKVNALSQLVTDYNDALSERESGQAQKVALTKELEELFDQVDDLLKNELDPMIIVLEENNPEFARTYEEARGIKNL